MIGWLIPQRTEIIIKTILGSWRNELNRMNLTRPVPCFFKYNAIILANAPSPPHQMWDTRLGAVLAKKPFGIGWTANELEAIM